VLSARPGTHRGDRPVRRSGDGKPRVFLEQAAQRGVSKMANVATDLKQRFDWAMDVCLEAYEVLPDGRSIERSDQDELAIEIFKRLGNTIDAIPPSLVASAEQIRAAQPELFEKLLTQVIGTVGSTFSPADATEFVDEVFTCGRWN
jgi:hypothetical protein